MNTSSASARGLRLLPLRSPPRPGSCSSPAGSRARAQSHTPTPRRRNNCNNRGSRSPAAGRTPRPPAGRSVTVSPRRRCWNVVLGAPGGFWKEQDHVFTAKPGAPTPEHPQPLQAVSVCQKTFPMGILPVSVHPCSSPRQPHPSSALVWGRGSSPAAPRAAPPGLSRAEQPGLPRPCRSHRPSMPFTFVTK